jgi:hypothetical protein
MNKIILFSTVFIVVSCKTIQVTDESDLEKSTKQKTVEDPKGGIYYRLPATRYKVVVKGKKTNSKSPLLASKEEVIALLRYPMPFIDKEIKGEVEIESVSLVPETVADESTLFKIEFGGKSLFRKFDFSYKGNILNAPTSGDIKLEGSPVTFVVGLAGALVQSIIVGGGGASTGLKNSIPIENPMVAAQNGNEVQGLPADFISKVDPIPFKDKLLDFAHNHTYKSKDNTLFVQKDSLVDAFLEIYKDTRKSDSKEVLDKTEASIALNAIRFGTIVAKTTTVPLSTLTKSQREMIDQYNDIKDRQKALASAIETKDFTQKMDYWKTEEARYVRLIGGFKEVTDYEFSFDWYPGSDDDSITRKDGNYEFTVELMNKKITDSMSRNISADGKGTGIYYRIPYVSRCKLSVNKVLTATTSATAPTKEQLFSRIVNQRIAQLGALVSLPNLEGYRRNQGFTINQELGTLEAFSLSGKALSAEDSKSITDFATSIPTIKDKRKQYAYDQEQKAYDQQLKLLKSQSDVDAAIDAINESKDSSTEDILKANRKIQALIDQLNLLKKLDELQKK